MVEQTIVRRLKGPMEDAIASNQCSYRPKAGTTAAILQLLDDCLLTRICLNPSMRSWHV